MSAHTCWFYPSNSLCFTDFYGYFCQDACIQPDFCFISTKVLDVALQGNPLLIDLAAVLLGDEVGNVSGSYCTEQPSAVASFCSCLDRLSVQQICGFLCLLLFGFGWARPVPVNIANFRNRRWGMALTALAGPVSNFITAFIAYCLYFVVRMNMTNTFLWSLSQFLLIVASMSVGLGVFNLVPVHPLDGSRVVDAFMPFSWSLKLQKYQNIIFFVFIVALWFGWLDGIMDWVGNGVLMLAVNFVSLFL